MRLKIFPLTLLAAALSLTACRSNTTYKFPTEESSFTTRTAAQDDLDIFNESYKNFATKNIENLSKSNDNFTFPVLTSYQVALTLLTASEGETYSDVAHVLFTDAPDDYSLVQGFNNLITPYSAAPHDSVKFGSSVWMVWPILLQGDFQDETAARISSDVIRLGSFGLTAQWSVQRWFDRFYLRAAPPKFDRSSPMMSYGAFSAIVNVQFEKAEEKSEAFWIGYCTNAVGESVPFRIVAWRQTGEFSLPSEDSVTQFLAKDEPTPSSTAPLRKEIQAQLDIAPFIEAVGSHKLLTGPNDLRNMSVEIVPEGDPIGMPIMLQYANLSLSIKGENPFNSSIGYAIYDKATGLPLVIGKSTF